ncbi:E3 ubiquitin-protein ligase SINA-like 11 isoform X3 [Triticum urartu]|nr:E3 ubiquitin-protein ligase SINA-like 11 isoform X3 [Triticum urartu]
MEKPASKSARPMEPPSPRTALENLTLVDADALDCGVCFLPLKPPIFQCMVGHVLCSQCRDKLASARSCHVCRAPMDGGYRRSHAMEKLVDSIRAPCPNAPYGCATKPAYHDLQPHIKACQHAPCHCPEEACGFVGSTETLLAHFTTGHGWPCTTDVRAEESFHMELREGFNVVDVVDLDGAMKLLFLVMVSPERLGRAISAVCVRPPRADGDEPNFYLYGLELEFDRPSRWHGDRQKSCFDVECTDLSDGLPNADDRFQFLVPHIIVLPYDDNPINIRACIYTQIR